MPENKDFFAISKPSWCEICFEVAIANPALAQTTLFWASVPFPLIISTKIVAASFTVFPPKIASCLIFETPKSSGEKSFYV